MTWNETIDGHWNDFLALALIILAIPAYVWVNEEFGALIAGAGIGVIKGDRSQRKADRNGSPPAR